MREYHVSETLTGAFRTLPEALDAIKADEHTFREKESARIIIHGMQHLKETIHITDEQLPAGEHRVYVIGADEKSGFSGGIPVTGFTYWKDNIWRIKVPEADCTRHLFVDGKAAKHAAMLELLGKPLEWYFDCTEKMLYVGLGKEDIPQNHEIVLPCVEQLIEIKGDLKRKFCCIQFQNLQFSHTTWLSLQKHEVLEIQADKVTAAVRIIAAKDTGFKGCTFTALGTGALLYEYGSQLCKIIGNHFCEIDGNAICMGNFYPEYVEHSDDWNKTVRWIEVANNDIHDIGWGDSEAAAIRIGNAQGITIAHNEIHG